LTELDIKRKASELLQKGRLNEAAAEYEALIGQSKRPNPAILNLIGDIYLKTANYERAFESYLHASRVYADEGLYHNGIAVGKKILRLDKEQVDIYGMLGSLYAKQGLGMDAVKFLKEYARRKEALNEYPAALAAFAEACEILSDFPEIHVTYGEMLERVDRDEDAASCYEAASRAYTDRGLPDRASKWAAKADQLRGGAATPAPPPLPGESVHMIDALDDDDDDSPGMSDLMNLRSLDDAPVKPRKSARGREDLELELDPGPMGVVPPRRSTAPEPVASKDDPFIVYNPKANKSLPPPPPLPPREPAAERTQDLVLDAMEASPAESETLDTLPGIIMPPGARKSSAEIPAPKVPRRPSSRSIERPEFSEEPVASDAGMPATPALEEFFEASKEGNREQAVVIGDDFELIREGGDVSEVIADFREATMEILDLDDFQAHYDLGTTYMEMELFDEAAAEFEIAARGEDFALPSREMLGYCFLRRGQIDAAIHELKRGLDVPGHHDRDKLGLYYNLGIACGVLDQEDAAIENFQRILEVDPDFRDTKSRLERLVQNSSR